MSGHNRGRYTKGKGQVDVVLGAGCWSGRSMAYKKGPGAPAKKQKKSAWWSGFAIERMYDGKMQAISQRFNKRKVLGAT